MINVKKRSLYKTVIIRRLSCTFKTAKIHRFVRFVNCKVLFHHYSASSILLSKYSDETVLYKSNANGDHLREVGWCCITLMC